MFQPQLMSSSYDGTVKLFDITSQKFTQGFASYDDSPEFKGQTLLWSCDVEDKSFFESLSMPVSKPREEHHGEHDTLF